jgi:hypothetical protein
MYRLSSSNASYASLIHWNFSFFLRSLKKWNPLTPSLVINLLRAAMHSVKLCTPWRLLGGFMFVIADTLGKGQFHVGRSYN